jgi:phosphoribosylformimino-5-aminoimidazole carboxamide ribotide isomerase
MRIIPAIDLIDGKCVRLSQGDYTQKKVYHDDALQVAKTFEAAGLRYLHLVDLDGAKAGNVINWNVVEAISAETSLIIDFGGGIKTTAEIEKLFRLGVHQVNLGSIAVKDPARVQAWIKTFGREKIVLSADVKNNTIAISGWQEDSSLDLYTFIDTYIGYGIEYITCTDISTDGMLQGPNISLYQDLTSRFPFVKVIASGGVSRLDDLQKLKTSNVDGVIVGKAIYEEKITLHELAEMN